MNTISRVTVLSLALAFGLGGCKSTVNSVSRERPQARPDLVDSHVRITDQNLNEEVSVQHVAQTRLSGGLLKVQVALLNKTSDTHAFNYKFEWYDAQGMLVKTASSGWRPSRIYGSEQKVISAIAPSPDVVDFKLKLLASQQ